MMQYIANGILYSKNSSSQKEHKKIWRTLVRTTHAPTLDYRRFLVGLGSIPGWRTKIPQATPILSIHKKTL